MSTIAVNAITNAAGGNTATINGMTPTADSLQGFRNRIINGGMVIDQRNNGASVTPTNAQYTVDRWVAFLSQSSKYTIQQNAGSVTPPPGFSNYLGVTSSSAYSVLAGDFFIVRQAIEGFNFSDMAWGTANAQPVTLSFWVRSSLTGTFGGAFGNSASNRSYPYTYTINSANTWEYKTVTIAGDTSGTWVGATNGVGVKVDFAFGVGSTFSGTAGSWAGANLLSATGAVSVVGTSGATFYITGVQLEAGSVATPFERRPYGTELALCQRYYFKWLNNTGSNRYNLALQAYSSSAAFGKLLDLPVTMRSTPTCAAVGTFRPINATGSTQTALSSTGIDSPTNQSLGTGAWTGSSGLVAGNVATIEVANNAYIEASAEL